VTEAKALKLVFKVTLNKSNQQALSQILKEQNHALVEVSSKAFQYKKIINFFNKQSI